jgi:hypothetical protein
MGSGSEISSFGFGLTVRVPDPDLSLLTTIIRKKQLSFWFFVLNSPSITDQPAVRATQIYQTLPVCSVPVVDAKLFLLDPDPNIHSFTKPTILKVFSWLLNSC